MSKTYKHNSAQDIKVPMYIDPNGPCEGYCGKMAGDFPCINCGWLWSEHDEDDYEVDYGD
jgi:hypothetical protein